jgi:ribosomal protein S6--L-glutamate ligase
VTTTTTTTTKTTTTTTKTTSRTSHGPRLELWVESRAGQPAVNPVLAALLRHLAADGRPATVRVPELDPLGQVRNCQGRRPDLVLLKTVTTIALSLAVADEAAGGVFLNTAAATSAAGDKAAVIARLSCAGVPVPASYLIDPGGRSGDAGRAAPDAAGEPTTITGGGWVSKPVFGWHGAGVRFHERLTDALAPAGTAPVGPGWLVDDGTRLVQRRVGADEPDLKVYVAGERMFAAAKVFSSASYASDEMRSVELDGAQRDVVRAAGKALGLRLFGVDLRADEAAPVVIDVNPFPGYRGFPEAMPALLAEINRACRVLR